MSYSDEIQKVLDSQENQGFAPMSKEESISETLKRLAEKLGEIHTPPINIEPFQNQWLGVRKGYWGVHKAPPWEEHRKKNWNWKY